MGAGANATNALPESVKGDTIAATKLLGPAEIWNHFIYRS